MTRKSLQPYGKPCRKDSTYKDAFKEVMVGLFDNIDALIVQKASLSQGLGIDKDGWMVAGADPDVKNRGGG